MNASREPLDLTLPPNLGEGDPRLDAPSFRRNGLPIATALAPRLDKAAGEVLEIGSGSGQHVALLAHRFAHLVFQPSDPDPAHRASIDAWRAHHKLETIRPAIDLDVSKQDWSKQDWSKKDWPKSSWPGAAGGEGRGFSAIFCANVIHIAPWAVAEGLFRGAAEALAPDGFLALYGPFRWHGRHVSHSNQAFDAQLRMRDAAWGVRDIEEIDRSAVSGGLARTETLEMPANNDILIFERAKPDL